MVKLVDAGDSKSPGPCAHVGSIPTSGTNFIKGLHALRVDPFVHRFGSGVHIVSTENFAKVFYGFLLVRLGEVGIPHGHLKSLVTEQLLYRGEIRAVHDEVACESVAEIVESEVRDACFFAGVVEGGAEVGDRSAAAAKEYLGILRASFQRAECIREGGVHLDDPALTVL